MVRRTVTKSLSSREFVRALPTERRRVDEVDELLLPVDLDDGDQLAVARLELRVAVDRDLLELEAKSRAPRRRPRAFAEVAPFAP